jgi:hypothetical protein
MMKMTHTITMRVSFLTTTVDHATGAAIAVNAR